MLRVGQSRNNKGRFSSEFGVDVELIGAADLAYAIQVLGEKDAKRIAKLAVRDTLKDMQRTAQGAVAADKGETREQIQISLNLGGVHSPKKLLAEMAKRTVFKYQQFQGNSI